MSISAGFTAEEIREFVLVYQALPQARVATIHPNESIKARGIIFN